MPTMHEFAEGQRVEVAVTPAPDSSQAGHYSLALVEEMYAVLRHDRTRFEEADDYVHGRQRLPWAPQQATEELNHLQRLSIANITGLIVELPSEVSYVDDYRRGGEPNVDANGMPKQLPEWDVWQKNRMDARQGVLYTAADTYGQAFLLVNNLDPKNVRLDILPTRNTVAYFYDPVNDIRPGFVLTIKALPRTDAKGNEVRGLALFFDSVSRYELEIDSDGKFYLKGRPIAHGLGEDGFAPVVRYTCKIDDEGRTEGLVIPNIPHQDRINQASFNTNVTANYGSFKVRWASGLQVNFRRDPDTGEVMLDPETKKPIPEPVEVSQARMLVSPDPNVKFGQLDETPLEGYIRAEERAFENFTTLAQFPPLAQVSSVANLSAEALEALETQFMRFVLKLQTSWGESHEEVFRLICRAIGDEKGATSFGGEVRWRDMRSKSLGVIADAFGKLAAQVGVPHRALWGRIPGMTRGDVREMSLLAEQQLQDEMAQQAQANTAAAGAQERPWQTAPGRPRA